VYGKNGFAEISKNLDTNLKIILLDHQNNYVSIDDNTTKSFNILATSLNVVHNYFDSPKLFSDLAKFLNISAKPFFPCTFDF